MGKIPEYTRKAIDRYNDKFDRVTVRLDKGTRSVIEGLPGVSSLNDYVRGLVYDDLRGRGLWDDSAQDDKGAGG